MKLLKNMLSILSLMTRGMIGLLIILLAVIAAATSYLICLPFFLLHWDKECKISKSNL